MQLSLLLEVVMSIRHVERVRSNASKRPLMLLMTGTTLVAGGIYGGVYGCAHDNVTTLPEIVIQAGPNGSDASRTAELHPGVPNR